jgi:C4-dicarboxylate-specific signal transduction histidine kinase
VIELTRGEAVTNGVLVQAELADDLPALQADRVQVQQVILNLIINAIEAMSNVSEGARKLLVATSKTKAGALVMVEDSGPGLSPARLEHAFDAFYTTKPSGLGLGLSICRSIIEAHGGRMWATPNVPCGAIFQFALCWGWIDRGVQRPPRRLGSGRANSKYATSEQAKLVHQPSIGVGSRCCAANRIDEHFQHE